MFTLLSKLNLNRMEIRILYYFQFELIFNKPNNDPLSGFKLKNVKYH